MDWLHCTQCESQDVEVVHEEGDEVGDQAELECSDCGNIEVITRMDAEEFLE